MKQNHYYTHYYGNKRKEIKDIMPLINLDNITTIIEPFAGSAAMSYYISTLYPKRFKYILNDNDKINYDLFNTSRDPELTQKFNEDMNKLIDEFNTYTEDVSRKVFYTNIDIKTLVGYVFKTKYCNIRTALYPYLTRIKQIKTNFKLQDFPVYDFYNNEDITYSNIDGAEIMKNYDEQDDKLFLLDPPYLKTSKENGIYNNLDMGIYDWILNDDKFILESKNKFIFILEIIDEVEILFSNFKILMTYEKQYCMIGKTGKPRKTKHIVYSN
jgi:hypothetical protein